jgi:phospholipase C
MQQIDHIVVLMLENRSFDHMLGFTRRAGYDVNGLDGSQSNPLDPAIPAGERVHVSPDAGFILAQDPGHQVSDVNVQLFGRASGPPPVGEMNEGFIYSYGQQKNVTPKLAKTIMRCFNPSALPVLTTLAGEFAVCDRWFSSVPGPTQPNRMFALAATSGGYIDNSVFNDYDMPTIFENVSAKGLTWRNYYDDFSLSWLLTRLTTDEMKVNFRSFGTFLSDAKKGTLPNFAFIEPKYTSIFGAANDQHPPHDVRNGEKLIAATYSAIKNSPAWERTLLLIVWDEHGGTYDHEAPTKATPPDSQTGKFAFNRYGVRVPAVLISPFIGRETIVKTEFDHTSIPATVKEVFGLGSFLTSRDAKANVFSGVPQLAHPRADVPDFPKAFIAELSPALADEDSISEEELISRKAAGRVSSEPLTDLQQSLVELAHKLDLDETPELKRLRIARRIENEYDAAVYLREVARRFMSTRSGSTAS